MKFPKEGYLYIAAGDIHIPMAARSAKSLKKVDPEAHITLFCTKEDTNIPSIFDCVEKKPYTRQLRKGDKPRYFTGKVDHIYNTPYQRTWYFDADTYICESVREEFNLLNYFDICMCHAGRAHEIRNFNPPHDQIPGAVELNGGVILFQKNKRTLKWSKLFRKYFYSQEKGQGWMQDYTGYREQASILWAIFNSKVRLFTLCGNYDCFNRRPQFLAKGPVKIIHGKGTTELIKKQQEAMNESLMDRAWIGGKKGRVYE